MAMVTWLLFSCGWSRIGQWRMTVFCFFYEWLRRNGLCVVIAVRSVLSFGHSISMVRQRCAFFFQVAVQRPLVKGRAGNWRGSLFWSLVFTGVTKDAWRAEVGPPPPVAFVTANGASETLHHKISVANIWPWHVTMQQTTDSETVAVFCRSCAEDCGASRRLF